MVDTRVEKFKTYRQEIQNSFSESDLTTKKKTSERVEKVLDEREKDNLSSDRTSNTSIAFDDLMNTYEIYNKGADKKVVSPLEPIRKKRLAYRITAWIICSALAVALIVVGIIYFGGY